MCRAWCRTIPTTIMLSPAPSPPEPTSSSPEIGIFSGSGNIKTSLSSMPHRPRSGFSNKRESRAIPPNEAEAGADLQPGLRVASCRATQKQIGQLFRKQAKRPDPGGIRGMGRVEIVAPAASETVDFEPVHINERREGTNHRLFQLDSHQAKPHPLPLNKSVPFFQRPDPTSCPQFAGGRISLAPVCGCAHHLLQARTHSKATPLHRCQNTGKSHP